MTTNTHGGKRLGSGRKPNELPSQRLVIHATDDEYRAIIASLTPRERTEKLLRELQPYTDRSRQAGRRRILPDVPRKEATMSTQDASIKFPCVTLYGSEMLVEYNGNRRDLVRVRRRLETMSMDDLKALKDMLRDLHVEIEEFVPNH